MRNFIHKLEYYALEIAFAIVFVMLVATAVDVKISSMKLAAQPIVPRYNGIVRLANSTGTCTGVVISSTLLLTASHCVDGEPLDVRPSSNLPIGVMGLPVWSDLSTDQALVSGPFAEFKPMKLGSDTPAVSSFSTIIGCGYADAQRLICMPYRFLFAQAINYPPPLTGIILHVITGPNQAVPGMSGGPMINSNGEVIGLMSGIDTNDKRYSFYSPLYNPSELLEGR